MTLLALRQVDASYGASRVLHGVSLEVPDGGMVALLGANGAGKTTTLRAICQLDVATRGEIRFAGTPIDRCTSDAIARLGVGHVPDGRGTFAALTVEDNLRIGALRRPRDQLAAELDRMFGYFPVLAQRLRQQAGTLSGGEQQMLAIARALIARPRLLLLDEPSFGLAPIIVRDIFAILRAINRDHRTAILLVEQNAQLAFDLVERVYLLEAGRVVLSGPPAELAADAAVRRAYLGR